MTKLVFLISMSTIALNDNNSRNIYIIFEDVQEQLLNSLGEIKIEEKLILYL